MSVRAHETLENRRKRRRRTRVHVIGYTQSQSITVMSTCRVVRVDRVNQRMVLVTVSGTVVDAPLDEDTVAELENGESFQDASEDAVIDEDVVEEGEVDDEAADQETDEVSVSETSDAEETKDAGPPSPTPLPATACASVQPLDTVSHESGVYPEHKRPTSTGLPMVSELATVRSRGRSPSTRRSAGEGRRGAVNSASPTHRRRRSRSRSTPRSKSRSRSPVQSRRQSGAFRVSRSGVVRRKESNRQRAQRRVRVKRNKAEAARVSRSHTTGSSDPRSSATAARASRAHH